MAKMPSLPFYVSDFLSDTAHLDGDSTGAYALLLLHYWLKQGGLPNDDRQLARLVRQEPKKWLKIKADLLPFFTLTDGLLVQKRMEKVIAEAKERSEKAKISAEERWKGRTPKALPGASEGNANASAKHQPSKGFASAEQSSSSSSSYLPSEEPPIVPRGDVAGGGPVRMKYRDDDMTAFCREWNAQGLPEFRKVPVVLLNWGAEAGPAVEALSYYTAEEILAAIRNYAEIIHKPEVYRYDGRFKSPARFFIGGVSVFAPSSNPLQAFRRAPAPWSQPAPELSKAPEALVCAACGSEKPPTLPYCTNSSHPESEPDNVFISPAEFARREGVPV